MKSLCGDNSRSYLGRSASVPVSRACLKGRTNEATHLVRAEVSSGRSTELSPPTKTGRAKRILLRKNH